MPEEAVEAAAGRRETGIRVVMITGDHAVTALAIARDLGIAAEEEVVEDLTTKPADSFTDDEVLTLMEWLRIGLISMTVVVEIDKLVSRVIAANWG